jgi:hypothetical protein
MTILKVGVAVAVGLALLYVLFILIAINSLRDPPFDPPEVAPLGKSATFQADRIVETEAGYVVAGVVGTSDPLRRRQCSGRFALVYLDERGRATRAAVLSGLERSRYCAERVDALVSTKDGGVLVAGTGIRDGGPSGLFPGKPSTDSLPVTFRVGAGGALVDSFGDDGVLEGHRAAGRVDGAMFTTRLERITERGAIRDDLVVSTPAFSSWRSFEVDDDLLVAIDYGPGLTFQTFERDAPSVVVYRPLHSTPSEPTVEVGTNFGIGDTLLRGGVMYVAVRDHAGTRLNAVDPRRLRLLVGFAVRGAIRLPGHTTSTELMFDGANRLVVATTTIDRGHSGDRLHVLRFGADGSADAEFGGRVKRSGRDVLLDPGLDDALVDTAGRTLVLGGESMLVTLDPSGAVDTTFGDEGVVQLQRPGLCELPPARRADACRGP